MEFRDRYKLMDLIGSGTYGDVIKAYDTLRR